MSMTPSTRIKNIADFCGSNIEGAIQAAELLIALSEPELFDEFIDGSNQESSRLKKNIPYAEILILRFLEDEDSPEDNAIVQSYKEGHFISEMMLGLVHYDADDIMKASDILFPFLTKLKTCPKGSFWMGNIEQDSLRHRVELSQDIEIMHFPVTELIYYSTLNQLDKIKNPLAPITHCSWFDALSFCNALSIKNGLQAVYDLSDNTLNLLANGYRLPTEAEWEYCAKAGTEFPYSGAHKHAKVAWTNHNADSTKAVGQLLPNAWKIFDMSGNVFEWIWDSYAPYPAQSLRKDPIVQSHEEMKIIRGGSFFDSADYAAVHMRMAIPAKSRTKYTGFRMVKNKASSIIDQ